MQSSLRHSKPPSPVPFIPKAALPNGTMIARYRILGFLGSGGAGAVYEAEDTVIRRRVALKLLPAAASDRSSIDRFTAELQAAGGINHPNVITIYDCGRWADGFYIAMELASGGSIKSQIAKFGRLEWREAVRVTAAVCRGLQAAHNAGILHCDVKPSNILIAGQDVKLADFGLAKLGVGSPEASSSGAVGTPSYMSPEQCRAEPLDARTDIYGLGATLHTLLTGLPPYSEVMAIPRLLFSHCYGPVPDPTSIAPQLPKECSRIVRAAMAKARQHRYRDATAMQQALEALLVDHSPQNSGHRNRRKSIAAAAAAMLLAILVALATWRFDFTNTETQSAPPASAARIDLPIPLEKEEARFPKTKIQDSDPAELDRELERLCNIAERAVEEIEHDRLGQAVEALRRFAADRERFGSTELAVRARMQAAHFDRLRCLETFDGHRGWVHAVTFGPKEGQLTVANEHGLRTWQLDGERRFTDSSDLKTATYAVAQFHKSASIAAVGQDRIVRIRSSSNNSPERRVMGARLPIWSVAISPDDSRIAAAEGDSNDESRPGRVLIWNADGKLLHTLTAHLERVFCVRFSPDGRMIASSGVDGVRLFDVETGNEVGRLDSHRASVQCVEFSPDGRTAVSCDKNGAAAIWSVKTQRIVAVLRGHEALVRCVAFSPKGGIVATAGFDGTVRVWNARTGDAVAVLRGHRLPVLCVAFSADGRRLASGGTDRCVKIWHGENPDLAKPTGN